MTDGSTPAAKIGTSERVPPNRLTRIFCVMGHWKCAEPAFGARDVIRFVILVAVRLETTGCPGYSAGLRVARRRVRSSAIDSDLAGWALALRRLCDGLSAAAQGHELWACLVALTNPGCGRWFVPIENVIGERTWCFAR